MYKYLLTYLLCSGFALGLGAQDLHLSNYQPAGMLFNPGLTALNGADVQLGVQYRSQWAAIPAAYTTMGATAEWKVRQVGLGLQVHQNKAGEASLKTTGVMATGAYHKRLAQEGVLSLGIGVGRLQKRINPALLTFDNQYSEGTGFNPAQSNGENFVRTAASFTDFAIGLLWKGYWGASGNVHSTAGLSLSHIQLPDEGFFGEKEILPMKTVIHGRLGLKLDNQLLLIPHLLFQKQGVHRELTGGLRVNGTFDKQSDFNVGMAYRWGDAVIMQIGFEVGNKSFWASYDTNISPLKTATSGKGAWEMGLYLRFDHNKKKRAKDTDGDGVYDHRDKCVKVPGLPELDGCPDVQTPAINTPGKDSDHDGVPDDLDRCPLEPGLPCFYGCNDADRDGTFDNLDACPNIFGHPDNQGCPVKNRDADRDGVPDSEDYCVFLKGLPQFHGCPDSDRDGISDIDDECPYIKGFARNNGCPDNASLKGSLPATVVHFDTDKSYVKPEFRARLDELLRGVPDFQAVTFMVTGHTDGEGTAAYNYDLGLRRAQAVQSYLVQHGVPFHKIKIMSFGEALPVRDNLSREGKAINRRTEVTVIEDR